MRKSERYENLNAEIKTENALKRMTESWHTWRARVVVRSDQSDY